MADMTTIKGRIAETIYPNGQGAITAESHQALLLEMVDDINTKKADQSELIATKESLDALEQKVDNLPQGEEFDKQGNYPLLHVGTADDLAGRGESVPAEFGFRASGGKSIKDGRAYIKRIKGNSVVWNQSLENGDFSQGAMGWYALGGNSFVVEDGVATITLEGAPTSGAYAYLLSTSKFKYIVGHKYLISAEGNIPRQTTLEIQSSRLSLLTPSVVTPSINTWTRVAVIGEGIMNESGTFAFFARQTVGGWEAGDQYKVRNYQIIDLTKMFGAGNEPTTTENFYARVATLGIKDMNAYNEGEVIHCNTESIKSVGDNAWDEEWEVGALDETSGKPIYASSIIRSKNYIPVLPNEQYIAPYYLCAKYEQSGTKNFRMFFYDEAFQLISSKSTYTNWTSVAQWTFTTPSNCRYIKFRTNINDANYDNDISIVLKHSGWKAEVDNTYKPYWQDTLPLPIIRKYFPDGMKSAGTAHDEVYYDKMQNKKFAVQRMGQVNAWELAWDYMGISESNPYGRFSTAVNGRQINRGNILCAIYTHHGASYTTDKNIFGAGDANSIVIIDSAYTDKESFKAMLQEKQVVLYYELETPIVTELDAEDQNFRDYYNVADFGTEMSQSSVPSAPFSADIIYQFNAVDMIREHEIEITELQSIITEQQSVIATMQAQLTSLINGKVE